MTKRLNKLQKHLLNLIGENYPLSISGLDLLKQIKEPEKEVLANIQLLENCGLVEAVYGCSSFFPFEITITAKGKEKLNETISIRLADTAHNNPWVVITAIIALLAILIPVGVGIYYSSENSKLQNENAQLQKPLLITPDIRAQGNSLAELKFIVKNPSHSIDYYYVSGVCTPEFPDLFSNPPLILDNNTAQNNFPKQQNVIPTILQTQTEDIPIIAGGEITLYCSNNYIKSPTKNITTYIDVCVNFRNIIHSTCNKMQITVLKV